MSSLVLTEADVVKTIRSHIPSLTDEDESDIDDLAREYVVKMNEDVDAADLAQRTCACGVKISGFYAYVDHLNSLFGHETHYGG